MSLRPATRAIDPRYVIAKVDVMTSEYLARAVDETMWWMVVPATAA